MGVINQITVDNTTYDVQDLISRPILTQAEYNALEQAGLVDTDKDYHISNGILASAPIDDDDVSEQKTWSSEKIADATAFSNIPSNTVTVSCANGTFTTITTIAITAGTWMLVGQCAFTSNGGMNAIVMVEDSESNNNTLTNSTAVRASTGSSDIQKVRIYSTSTNKTIYLRAFQNSGSAMDVTGNLRAVKLSNTY